MTKAREARLVGDFGATHARLGLSDRRGRLQLERSYLGAGFSGLSEVISHYYSDIGLAAADQPRQAALAIAAPLLSDTVRMTNLNWSFSAAATRAELGLQRLLLLNDFTALALSLPTLAAAERVQIGGGEPRPRSAIALLGPGSGLGVSGLVPAGRGWSALMGEGGHVTLPACTPRESALLDVVRRVHPHVSAERLLSGGGLYLLYQSLCQLDGVAPTVLQVESVTAHALSGSDKQCVEAVQLFCQFLGTVAGNLTLTLGAHGGCFIGGGIVPRLLPVFAQSGFRERFEDKGRYSTYLATIPVFVITLGNAALRGCARAFSGSVAGLEAA